MKTKTKRILAFIICVATLVSMMVVTVNAEETQQTTVTLTVSQHGELLEEATLVPVELSGKEAYNLDDVFSEAHALYYDGDDGYASEGISIKKFWGDESGFFNYRVNGSSDGVYGLDFTVNDGDHVEVAINKNEWPDTELYTKFDVYEAEIEQGKNIELTLSESGLDENWEVYVLPCEGANIVVDGEVTELVTDAEGKVVLSFEEMGTHIVSAKKAKELKGQEVPAIAAPVCRITVKEPASIEIIHNIADIYSGDVITTDGNMIWFVADMMVYNELYPEYNKALSDEVKQACIDKIIAGVGDTTSANMLAKSIIALRSMGYDAREVYGADLKKIDIVEKLTALVDEKSSAVTDMYTLPWVIIALRQGDDYVTDEQMSYLLGETVTNKEEWQYNEWGTDAANFILLALAPYYDINEDVRNVIKETIPLVTSAQTETGAIGNAASTGLAIAGLSAVGTDVQTVKNGTNTLIDGLMSQATDSLDGFKPIKNTFSTEQGFRGLLAWQLAVRDAGIMYDFASYPTEPAYATWQPVNCPVTFNVTPNSATVTVDNAQAKPNGKYDLAEGTYSYTVKAEDYETQTGTVTVSADEAQNHTAKSVTVSLEKESGYSGGGGGGSATKEDKKEEKEEVKEEIKEETPKTEISFDENTFTDVKKDDWYYDSIKYVYENNLMQGTQKGFEPESKMTRAMLVTVLYRLENPEENIAAHSFYDVMDGEWYADAVAWAANAGVVSGVAEGVFAPDENITREQMAVIMYRYALLKGYDVNVQAELTKYADVGEISSWAEDALKWADGAKIINGTSEITMSPKDTATRAQVATILMRFCRSKDE